MTVSPLSLTFLSDTSQEEGGSAMTTMEGKGRSTPNISSMRRLRMEDDADLNPQAEHTSDIVRLFSLDLVHCTRLSKEEEYALTRRTHAAWRSLLAILREQRSRLAAILDAPQTFMADDHLSEAEVLRGLQFVQTYVCHANQQEDAANLASLKLWAEKVKKHLVSFRLYRDEMVRRNLRLVVMLARRYQNRGVGLLDLVQEGALGLMRAVEKFDPERNVAFSSYAVWWIREAFLRVLAQREGTSYSLSPETAPVPVQLLSLDAPFSNEADDSFADVVTSPDDMSPEEAVINADATQGLRRALTHLPLQEAEILRLRFGLVDDQAYTYQEIGHRLRISREQVRLREQRALLRLRHQLQPVVHKSAGRQKPLCRNSTMPQHPWVVLSTGAEHEKGIVALRAEPTAALP